VTLVRLLQLEKAASPILVQVFLISALITVVLYGSIIDSVSSPLPYILAVVPLFNVNTAIIVGHLGTVYVVDAVHPLSSVYFIVYTISLLVVFCGKLNVPPVCGTLGVEFHVAMLYYYFNYIISLS
jgi:hypothetical protein